MKKKSIPKSNFQLVSANFRFRAEWKKVTSRAENPSARLGLITTIYALNKVISSLFVIENLEE